MYVSFLFCHLCRCGAEEGELHRQLTALQPLTLQSMVSIPPSRVDLNLSTGEDGGGKGLLPSVCSRFPPLKIVAAAQKAGIIGTATTPPEVEEVGDGSSGSGAGRGAVKAHGANEGASTALGALRKLLLTIESSIAWTAIEERMDAALISAGWRMPVRWRDALHGRSGAAVAEPATKSASAMETTDAKGESEAETPLAPWVAYAAAVLAGKHDAMRNAWLARVASASSPTEILLALLELESRIPSLFLAPRMRGVLLPAPNATKVAARLRLADAAAATKDCGPTDRHGAALRWSVARVAMRLYALDLALVEGPLFVKPRAAKRSGRSRKRGRFS